MKVCTDCGFTWGEIRSKGLVGCPECYQTFREEIRLGYLNLSLTDPNKKFRNSPTSTGPVFTALAELREALSAALLKEDFKLAQEIQSQIRTLGHE